MIKRMTAMAMVGALVLSGCGHAAPIGAMSAATGGFEAEAAKKNPFSGLTATVDPTAVLCPCVSVTATNDAKLKVVVATEDGALDTVTVNRSAIVKGGKLALSSKTAGGFALEAVTEAASGATAKRRTSLLTLLGKLADGLKAAKSKKEDAKAVDGIVDALKDFVKAEKAADKSEKAAESDAEE